uniref:NIF system FeS cluster assembly NifU N-terminal domain-containing protein n=1 Tax=Periophthalmus magnuspinnatus TaxID=409849 RepID=A0A3B4B983_9GOBI
FICTAQNTHKTDTHTRAPVNMAGPMMKCFSPFSFLTRRLSAPEIFSRCCYHVKVMDHYENPRNVGSLDKNSRNVGTGLVGAPACGDVMKLQIEVDDQGKIVDARFKTFGCGSAIASSSLATEWVKGKSVSHIYTQFTLLLAEDAIKAALADYHLKQRDEQQDAARANN